MNFQLQPVHQVVTGSDGYHQLALARNESMSVKQYRDIVEAKHPAPNSDDLDTDYWKQILKSVPLYGSEVEGTLFDNSCQTWNLNNLQSILDHVQEDYGMVRSRNMKNIIIDTLFDSFFYRCEILFFSLCRIRV